MPPGRGHQARGEQRRGDGAAPGEPAAESSGGGLRQYLLRVLAGQGPSTDSAHGQLLGLFGVEDLGLVSKFDATAMIDRLLHESPEEGLDRLTHRVHILEANGESIRLRRAKTCQKRPRATPEKES